MFLEAVGWVLLLLTLIPAVALVRRSKRPNPLRSKEKEAPPSKDVIQSAEETTQEQKKPDSTIVPLWNQYALRPSRWLEKYVAREEPSGQMKQGTPAERKKRPTEMGAQYTNENPPPLGQNCRYGGLLWRHFDHRGFHKMIDQWASRKAGEPTRIRTLLSWDESEIMKDLRFMTGRMLQGYQWTAHFSVKERPSGSWSDDDLLPDVYQVYREQLEDETLKKDYAKMMEERRRFGQKMAEKGTAGQQWEEARKRGNILDFKLRDEAVDGEKFSLFRHVKPRRKWGNSLYVYFGGSSVLITTDEVV